MSANTTTMFRGKVRQIHFIGIGGIGMSGIAEVLLELGYKVSGSDQKEGDTVKRLKEKGAIVFIGHAPKNIEGADVVVRSTAITSENIEVKSANDLAIPVIPRAEMLGELMRLKHGIAIAGTHGKTTTTSLVSAVLNHANLDPTVVIGGKVNQLGSNAKLGKGEYMVAEADESDGSFLKLNPAIAVVTNLDLDHVDYWTGGLEALHEGFVSFLNALPFYGLSVLCTDSENVQRLVPHLTRRFVSYGFSRQADYHAYDVTQQGLQTSFSLRVRGEEKGRITISLVGKHNVQNALAAIAIGDELSVAPKDAGRALQAFEGVQRRFTLRGEEQGVTVVDDYGHHPTEIKATLQGARASFPGRRIVVLFQPHRYSRTQALKEDFARAFNDADRVLITDVYAAGESSIAEATADALAEAIKNHGHRDVKAAGTLDDAIANTCKSIESGDVVLTLGAGNVTIAGPAIVKYLKGTKLSPQRDQSVDKGATK